MHRRLLFGQYYRMKVNLGSFLLICKKDVREIGKIFLRLNIVMAGFLQIQ
jgi:hypothetical protein